MNQPQEELRLVVGCNYHVKWSFSKAMRFVLREIKGDKVRLETRTTGKNFWTNKDDFIFITTHINKSKANKLELKTLTDKK